MFNDIESVADNFEEEHASMRMKLRKTRDVIGGLRREERRKENDRCAMTVGRK